MPNVPHALGYAPKRGTCSFSAGFGVMYLVEIFLPADAKFASKRRALARELTQSFGGVTAFNRSPARGLYAEGGGQVEDEIIVFEVMTETVDKAWWSTMRERLEQDYQQEEIVVRASTIERL